MKLIPISIICFLLIFIETANSQMRLAFSANKNDNWDIFTIDEDGNNLHQITNILHDEKTPSQSHDRNKIAYASNDGQLYIFDIRTKRVTPIQIKTQKETIITPSFSPSGKYISYAQFIPKGQDDTDLMLYNTETNTSQKIITQHSTQMWPTWSPDETKLIYSSLHYSSGSGQIIQELWLTSIFGEWARQLLMTNSFCQQPDWSPDGKKVAFSSDKSGNFDIWILTIDDWTLKQITFSESLDVRPSWSPDSKKIAFVSTRSGFMEIWVKTLSDGSLTRLQPFGNKQIECKDVNWR